ncbi:AAEL003717-PA, partial [Aedes aegypti]
QRRDDQHGQANFALTSTVPTDRWIESAANKFVSEASPRVIHQVDCGQNCKREQKKKKREEATVTKSRSWLALLDQLQ